MSFLVLPQYEQFYPELLSVFTPFPLGWIKLAPKFKDFPATTAIFEGFQGICILKFKNFQGVANPVSMQNSNSACVSHFPVNSCTPYLRLSLMEILPSVPSSELTVRSTGLVVLFGLVCFSSVLNFAVSFSGTFSGITSLSLVATSLTCNKDDGGDS